MRNMVARTALALVVMLGSSLVVAEPAAASAAACPQTPGRSNDAPGHFTGDGVNIRTGPSTSCTSRGLGYRSHAVIVHCYGSGWVYLTDTTTRVTGWSSSQFVSSSGAAVVC